MSSSPPTPTPGPPPPLEPALTPVPVLIKAPCLTWSDASFNTLLRLRVVTYGPPFLRSNGRAQLTKLWEKIRLSFNKKYRLAASIEQLKNKFNAVKALYGQTKAEETTTGNAEKPIEYPSYWSLLVQYFGHKKGLRNQDFGQSGVQLPPFAAEASDSEGSIPDSEVDEDPGVDDTGGTEEHSREEAIALELCRHDGMRKKRKLDLPEVVVAMGTSLAAALSTPDRSQENIALTSQLAEIQRTQQRMVEALEESKKVNAALLTFLTGNTGQP
ncbi:unnamed protein product [Phytophthora fragariaefolia]|uniref:Unnamed protein product n=1 Tax=Phytophthora fragariaefolia TaxID=1490495 RepID=A0A9W6WX63_9STRA|nr:unnamed protein product [Phytophthora fragariaefolia]